MVPIWVRYIGWGRQCGGPRVGNGLLNGRDFLLVQLGDGPTVFTHSTAAEAFSSCMNTGSEPVRGSRRAVALQRHK